MQYVEFYAGLEKIGELQWDDGDKITATNPELLGVLREEIRLGDGTIITADEPQRFMANLFKQYRSPYFSAMRMRGDRS